jgi:hypothetical protein
MTNDRLPSDAACDDDLPCDGDLRAVLVAALRPYASRIELFGSAARGTAGPDSDVDVLLTLRPPAERPPFGLKAFEIEQALADRLGRPVELVTTRALSRHVRPHVETDRVTLYDDCRDSSREGGHENR